MGQVVGRLIFRRLGVMAASVVAVTAVIFALAAASPFDPLAYQLGAQYGRFSEDELQALAHAMGTDKPWWQQLMHWWWGVFHGDLGFSRVFHKPVGEVVVERLPWTLLLSGVGAMLAFMLAFALGSWAAHHPQGVVSRVIRALGLVLAATPSFVVALAVIVVCGTLLHVIPLGGAAPPGTAPTLTGIGPYLIAPAVVLALSYVAWPLLAMQEATTKAWNSPAVEAAQLRGLAHRDVVRGHVLPLTLMPLVTVLGARFGELVVGAVIVETVFSWPGIAQATVEAALATDFPLLATVTAGTTLFVMVGALLSDVAYLVLDPRVSDV